MTTLQSFNITGQSIAESKDSATVNNKNTTPPTTTSIDFKIADSALERYSKIRVALYKNHLHVKDLAIQLGVTPPTVTRTIQGVQHNLKVIEWIKQNLGIDLPIPPDKFKPKPKKRRKNTQKIVFDPKHKKYFTPREVSFYYGIPYKTLAQQRFLKTGIPYLKLGKKILYAKKDIERYITSNSIKIQTR